MDTSYVRVCTDCKDKLKRHDLLFEEMTPPPLWQECFFCGKTAKTSLVRTCHTVEKMSKENIGEVV